MAPALVLSAVDLALADFVGRIAGAHPSLKARLAGIAAASILIEPAELPFALLTRIAPDGGPSVRIARPADLEGTTARISGSFLALLDLLEGRVDGDTLFFRRDLRVTGDVACVVALRNALDGENIDLAADLFSSFGLAADRLRGVGHVAAGLWQRIGAGPWQALFLAPIVDRLDRIDKTLWRLTREIESHHRSPAERP